VPGFGFLQQVTGQEHHRLISTERSSLHTLRLLLGTGTEPQDGVSPKKTLSQENTASNYVSRELVCDAFYRQTHHCQPVINSYFKWLMTLLICHSTVTFSNYQCKTIAKYTINLCCLEAWHLKDCHFHFICSAFFRKRIMIEAGKSSQKQHRTRASYYKAKLELQRYLLFWKGHLLLTFWKSHGKINPFPLQSRVQPVGFETGFADLIFIGIKHFSLDMVQSAPKSCFKIQFSTPLWLQRGLMFFRLSNSKCNLYNTHSFNFSLTSYRPHQI